MFFFFMVPGKPFTSSIRVTLGDANTTQADFPLADPDPIGLGWESQEITIFKNAPGLDIWGTRGMDNPPMSYMVCIHNYNKLKFFYVEGARISLKEQHSSDRSEYMCSGVTSGQLTPSARRFLE